MVFYRLLNGALFLKKVFQDVMHVKQGMVYASLVGASGMDRELVGSVSMIDFRPQFFED